MDDPAQTPAPDQDQNPAPLVPLEPASPPVQDQPTPVEPSTPEPVPSEPAVPDTPIPAAMSPISEPEPQPQPQQPAAPIPEAPRPETPNLAGTTPVTPEPEPIAQPVPEVQPEPTPTINIEPTIPVTPVPIPPVETPPVTPLEPVEPRMSTAELLESRREEFQSSIDQALKTEQDKRRILANQARVDQKNERLNKIMQFVSQHGPVSNQNIRDLLHVSQSTATEYLKSLVAHGMLKVEGAGNQQKYH